MLEEHMSKVSPKVMARKGAQAKLCYWEVGAAADPATA